MRGSGKWMSRLHAPRRQAFQASLRLGACSRRKLHHQLPLNSLSGGHSILNVLKKSPGVSTRVFSSGFSIQDDTIYALSTAHGRAGIAVIRISGPGCLDVYRALCPGKAIPKPRYATVRTLFDPLSSGGINILDSEALVLYFPAPKTVTGEDVLELHIHGGPATIKAVLSAIPNCQPARSPPYEAPAYHSGRVRYAEPGEFTRRAFLNNRLDLAQVESLSDALDAETEQQRRAAVRGGSGALGKTYEEWRRMLVLARGEIEALIDFSEDQHFDESPVELLSSVATQVQDLVARIALHESASQRNELLRNGIRIALLGPPNAGKSSLMNLIVGREASIVSTEAGTTRDIVEASLDIRGFLCSFADTAGFRGGSGDISPTPSPIGDNSPPSPSSITSQVAADAKATDHLISPIEREGIRRARQKAVESDIIIVLASVETGGSTGSGDGRDVAAPTIRYDDETLRLAAAAPASLVIINKRDAVAPPVFDRLVGEFRASVLRRVEGLGDSPPLAISCKEAHMQTWSPSGSRDQTRPTVGPPRGPSAGLLTLTASAEREDGTRLTSASYSPTGSSRAAPNHKDSDAADPGSIQAVVDALSSSFRSLTSLPVHLEDLVGVTERQRQLLATCRTHLEDFLAESGHSTVSPAAASSSPSPLFPPHLATPPATATARAGASASPADTLLAKTHQPSSSLSNRDPDDAHALGSDPTSTTIATAPKSVGKWPHKEQEPEASLQILLQRQRVGQEEEDKELGSRPRGLSSSSSSTTASSSPSPSAPGPWFPISGKQEGKGEFFHELELEVEGQTPPAGEARPESGSTNGFATPSSPPLPGSSPNSMPAPASASTSANPQRPPDVVLAAEHLRYAANSLARITGRGEVADIDEVLGVIFEKFCVGK